MSQEKYIEKALQRFQMIDAKPSSVPLQSQEKLSKAHYPKDKEETEKLQNTKMRLENVINLVWK